MELSQMRYFLEVAKNQHVTKTAEKLHIAQPALTKSIHRLESDLGVKLFVSKGRNIVLTEYGKYLQEKLIPILASVDEIPKDLNIMAKLEGETIHLNVLAASTLLTEAIIEYQKKNSELHFQLLQNSKGDLYDIGITTKMFYQNEEEEADNKFVCSEKIFLAVPKNREYAKQKSINLSMVKDEDFICLLGSKQFRWICDKFCQHSGFTPNIVFESDNPAAVKNMIAANMGVGFWPEFTWGKLESDKVILMEISEPICKRDILISYKNNKIDNQNVIDFFEFLKEYTIKSKKKAIKKMQDNS